ncbi:hypothetical protein SELMODRAFT_184750 [Selaginella moellendorffii]|uniref:STAS domain-containing protein n=1 Tax=Selaginella moellendorffii TaxID=88036 RepID=D8T281_SELML|nr:hypothetical protein SELMODRAFT_184750 [Selaginella moellendorffii]
MVQKESHDHVNDTDLDNVEVISIKDQVISQAVQRPPAKSLLQTFSTTSKETLFPDDPFRHFRNKPSHRQAIMLMQYFFPILDWLPKYKLGFLKNDFIAGITTASLSIPQGIAYAKLANLPPVVGLYSCFLPPMVYAIFGSSRDLAVGPAAVISIVLGTLIREDLGPEVTDPRAHLSLAFTSTFFAGLFQFSLGFLRLGFVIDFLSHAATVGFVAGVAVAVCLQQMRGILGIQNFTKKSDVVSVLHSIFRDPAHWNWRTVVIGICFLTFLLGMRQISKRNKKLFWLSAIAPVTSVFLATVCVFATHANEHLSIVGQLRKGINPPSFKELHLTGPLVSKAMKNGVIVAIIGLMEAIAVGRTFASIKNYHIDGNKEMIAFGMVNMTGSCMSCYITTGAMSRTAVNNSAGCKTSLSCIFMALIVMVTLLALTPLFHYTPNVILSVIIFSALITLIDPVEAYHIWKVDKIDFLACLGAFLGVCFQSIQLGLLIAVAISIGKILLHVSRPHTATLGKIAGTSIYRSIEQYPKAVRIPGVLIVRIDASIYFSNSNYIRERLTRYIEEEQGRDKLPGESALKYLILDLTPVMSIDTSGIHAFVEIHRALKASDIQLVLANPGAEVIERLHRGGFVDILGQRWISLTVDDAVHYCSMQLPRDNNVDNHEDVSECDVIVQIIPKFGL